MTLQHRTSTSSVYITLKLFHKLNRYYRMMPEATSIFYTCFLSINVAIVRVRSYLRFWRHILVNGLSFQRKHWFHFILNCVFRYNLLAYTIIYRHNLFSVILIFYLLLISYHLTTRNILVPFNSCMPCEKVVYWPQGNHELF